MRSLVRHTVPARAALLAVALVLLLPTVVLAHAELDTSSPADGDTVEGTPEEISADFTGALADGSTFELRNAAGDVVAEGAIDPGNDQRMILDPPELEPGTYEIRWQAIADDGHASLERGTYGFTVEAAPTPPPTPSAPPSAAPTETAAPSEPPSPSPSAAPTPTPDAEPTASTTDVLIPIIVAVVLLAALAGYLLNRRRATPRP